MTSLTLFLAALDLLLPGYAWILASGLNKQLSMLEKVVLSFVLSTCFSSLLAAALTFLTPGYLLLSTVLSLGGTAVVIVAYLSRRRPRPPAKQHTFSLSTGSRALDFCILVYAILILGLFWSAPYYPTAQAPDLLTHAQLTSSIVSGEGRNVLLESGYPVGLHFAAAIISSLVNIGALQALRIVASAALFSSVPLFFLSAREVLGNAKAAGAALLVVAFAMPADALHLFRIGTFPNLMSDMIILTVVWLVFRYVKNPSRALGATLTFLGVGGAFMHSSFLIILGVFWVAVPFAFILYKDEVRMYVTATSYSTLGLAVFGFLAFFSFHANLQRLAASYVVLGGMSVFRIALDEFTRSLLTFLGLANVAAIICAALFVFKSRRNLGLVFGFIWLLLMVPGALVSGQAYRFILFAMLPGSYLVGYMLANATDLHGPTKSTMLPKLMRTTEVVVLLLLIISGVFPSIVAESFNPTGRSYQSAVYDSMIWVEHNISCRTGVASAGLWPDYEYLPALTGVPYMGDFLRPPDYVLQKSASLGFHCLVVARNSEYFQQFANDTSFRGSYQNELVIVFAVA
jgi:hypothetical protein